MPQPLSKFKIAEGTITTFDVEAMRKRPKLGLLVAEVIANWAEVESWLTVLFLRLFGGNKSLSAKIYFSLDVAKSKTSAIHAAIASIKDEELRDVLHAIVKLSQIHRKSRDKLAHGIFGYVDELPDAILLWDWKQPLQGNLSTDNVYVYTEKDLNKIISNFQKIVKFGHMAIKILDGDSSNKDGQLFDELHNQHEILEMLNRRTQ